MYQYFICFSAVTQSQHPVPWNTHDFVILAKAGIRNNKVKRLLSDNLIKAVDRSRRYFR
jgi:hypothetical protein